MKKFNWPLACLYGGCGVMAMITIIHHSDTLIKNPLLFIVAVTVAFVPILLFFSIWLFRYFPYCRDDLNKRISEPPFKIARVTGLIGGWLCGSDAVIGAFRITKMLKLELFSKFFIVSFLGCCDKFSYSSIKLEKRMFGYTLQTKTSTGKNFFISINENLYTIFKQQKSQLKNK